MIDKCVLEYDKVILDIANEYGTPFYLYSLDIIAQRISLIKEVLGSNAHLYYSVKANPNIDVLEFIRTYGLGVEVSSLGELNLVQSIGFSERDIIFSGPCKSQLVLDKLLDAQIRCINVESVSEIEIIKDLCTKKSKTANISIRINPEKNTSKTGMKMTGTASQFGIDWVDLPIAIKSAQNSSGINLLGIQVYFGSQLLNATDIIENISQIIQYVRTIQNTMGFSPEFIDFGGGFGIPYFAGQRELDFTYLKESFLDIVRNNQDIFNSAYCIFESGRYIVGDAGVYVTSVVDRKLSRGKVFLICDGGSNHHANSAFLGRIVTGNFPIRVIHRTKNKDCSEIEKVTITGPLCSPTDVVGRDVEIFKCKTNDIIVIEKSGAYGLSHSPFLFILHSAPKEIVFQNGSFFESDGIKKIVNIVTNGI